MATHESPRSKRRRSPSVPVAPKSPPKAKRVEGPRIVLQCKFPDGSTKQVRFGRAKSFASHAKMKELNTKVADLQRLTLLVDIRVPQVLLSQMMINGDNVAAPTDGQLKWPNHVQDIAVAFGEELKKFGWGAAQDEEKAYIIDDTVRFLQRRVVDFVDC